MKFKIEIEVKEDGSSQMKPFGNTINPEFVADILYKHARRLDIGAAINATLNILKQQPKIHIPEGEDINKLLQKQ